MISKQDADKIYSFLIKTRLEAGRKLFDRFQDSALNYAVHKGAVLFKYDRAGRFLAPVGEVRQADCAGD